MRGSRDVAWLERVASSREDAIALAKPSNTLAQGPKDARTHAYARLGELATPESLAAVKRIEKLMIKRRGGVKDDPPKVWTDPSWGYGESTLRPIAQVKSPTGVSYSVVSTGPLGHGLHLTRHEPTRRRRRERPKNSWPVWIDCPLDSSAFRQLHLRIRDEFLELRFVLRDPTQVDRWAARSKLPTDGKGSLIWEVSLDELFRDTDKDGWTDLEEKRIGLDPKSADTDGDGIDDMRDVCPNNRPGRGQPSENDEIVARAFFAVYGLSGSRHLITVVGDKPPVTIWGYRGPVVFQGEGPAHGTRCRYMVKRKGNLAEVTLNEDYTTQIVALRKIDGRWTVVRRRTISIA